MHTIRITKTIKKEIIKSYETTIEILDEEYENLVDEYFSIEDIIEENETNFLIIDESEELIDEIIEWEDR